MYVGTNLIINIFLNLQKKISSNNTTFLTPSNVLSAILVKIRILYNTSLWFNMVMYEISGNITVLRNVIRKWPDICIFGVHWHWNLAVCRQISLTGMHYHVYFNIIVCQSLLQNPWHHLWTSDINDPDAILSFSDMLHC